jgi:hypothetical protein
MVLPIKTCCRARLRGNKETSEGVELFQETTISPMSPVSWSSCFPRFGSRHLKKKVYRIAASAGLIQFSAIIGDSL